MWTTNTIVTADEAIDRRVNGQEMRRRLYAAVEPRLKIQLNHLDINVGMALNEKTEDGRVRRFASRNVAMGEARDLQARCGRQPASLQVFASDEQRALVELRRMHRSHGQSDQDRP
jgi:hypothetical protein